MISQEAIEEAVLSLLVYHTEQSTLLALKITEPGLFTTQENQRIAEVTLDYISKYQNPPGVHLEDLLEQDLKAGSKGLLLRQQIDKIKSKAEEVDTKFINDELDHFLERQKKIPIYQKALEVLIEGDIEKADQIIHKVSSLPASLSSGIWMKDYKQALSFLERDEFTEFFSTGIELLDQKGVRLDRKTISFLIAASGKGKTWWLIEVGKRALQYHKKVLHITLELSEEKTARRYIQSIFGLTKNQIQQIRVPYFTKDNNGIIGFDFHQLERDSIFNKKDELRDKISTWMSCPDWLIKEFPTGTLSVEHLSLYMDSLEKNYGFKPDILIIDYSDLMKIDAQSLRIDTGRLYRELRGLVVTKNIAFASATQGNRDSESAKLVGSTNVSEDWSKIGTADNVFTYSQTPEEFKLGLARFFVAKARDEADRFVALISQCYSIGQFCIDSVPMNSQLANILNPQTH